MKAEHRTIGFLLVVGITCGLVGQFYFAYRREYMWDGVLFWAVSILAVSALMIRALRIGRQARWREALRVIVVHPLRTIAAGAGVWLSIAAAVRARQLPANADFTGVLGLWVAGIVVFLLAFAPLPRAAVETWRRLRTWVRRNRDTLIGLAAVLLFALIVRAFDLEHIPANLGGDEGTQGAAALELVSPPLGNPFSTGWYSVPTMSFLAYGLAMRLFGATVAGLRTLSALIGVSTVLTTFLLANELWGRQVGFLSAIVLACGHYHVHFSRLASNQVADAFFVTLVLWLLVRGLRIKRQICFALAGAMTGLGWYAYFGARLLAIILASYVALQVIIRHRFLSRYWRLLLVLGGAALVVLVPLLLYYAAFPDPFASRLRQVSIFASGWLAREVGITGRSTASLLLQQFWKAISAFNLTLDPTFWYRPTIPLLDLVSGLFFILGLVWASVHMRWPASSLLLIWFWLALILGWVVTENPPSSQRMVGNAPAVAMLVALGFNWAMGLLAQLFENRPTVWRGAAATILVAIVGLNTGYYFLVYTPSRVYGNPTAEMTTVLARDLRQRGGQQVVYFYGPPFVYWDFGTLQFMARGIAGIDVPPPGEGVAPEPDLKRGARFVFHPARLDELGAVRARYPGGLVTQATSEADGDLLYVMYEIGRQ